MKTGFLNRRTLATAVVASVAAVGSIAGVSFAQGNGTKGNETKSPAATETAQKSQLPASPADGAILAGVHTALQRLVANGTISQHQADAVQRQAAAGSIDPRTLVQSGLVNDAQMRAIGDSLDQVKQAAGN
ncbi:MAG: hypothetical protein WBB74_04595 [Gaiellaceae bacterium]